MEINANFVKKNIFFICYFEMQKVIVISINRSNIFYMKNILNFFFIIKNVEILYIFFINLK